MAKGKTKVEACKQVGNIIMKGRKGPEVGYKIRLCVRCLPSQNEPLRGKQNGEKEVKEKSGGGATKLGKSKVCCSVFCCIHSVTQINANRVKLDQCWQLLV